MIGIALCFSLALSANAQEINPAPGTYVYGSSSEFSPYVTLGFRANSNTLAPTGESQALPIVAIVAAFSLGMVLLFGAFKLHRDN